MLNNASMPSDPKPIQEPQSMRVSEEEVPKSIAVQEVLIPKIPEDTQDLLADEDDQLLLGRVSELDKDLYEKLARPDDFEAFEELGDKTTPDKEPTNHHPMFRSELSRIVEETDGEKSPSVRPSYNFKSN